MAIGHKVRFVPPANSMFTMVLHHGRTFFVGDVPQCRVQILRRDSHHNQSDREHLKSIEREFNKRGRKDVEYDELRIATQIGLWENRIYLSEFFP